MRGTLLTPLPNEINFEAGSDIWKSGIRQMSQSVGSTYLFLGGLRDKIPPDHPPFDIDKFREEGYDPALRE